MIWKIGSLFIGFFVIVALGCSADDRKSRMEVEKELLHTAQDCLKDPACKQALDRLVH